ncbi:hypothetical protein LY90DRAFT_675932 [Neocallimastix californiae]|uniref:Uncharacterized protein n=1 Tax=Neocallimastix californiae TaxID=1754190 RepID=A0A1Y2AK06_9FUNG|nr:hypothetical protein LY90DRAFT_675932 [Neocallimastix californiae]|eukprot:ORY22285.1 hypothetical protein LY90DRAFT_675932 [Neocallimastix californiae]
MKRSLKELKERQKKKRQNSLNKSNNSLTSYGFSSSRLNSKNNQNKNGSQEISPKENKASQKALPPLKRSQSLNIISNNLLMKCQKKKKNVIKNPFQDLNSNNTIVLDPFSLLKNITKVENDEDKDNESKTQENDINKLSSDIFNIDYLNLEMGKNTEPPEGKEVNDKDHEISSKENIPNSKKNYILKVDEEEFTSYNSRYIIESDEEEDLSLSEKESVASDTDIRDIIQDEEEMDYENDNSASTPLVSEDTESTSTTTPIQKNNKNEIKRKSSAFLLDTMKQNDEVHMDVNMTNDTDILSGIKKKKTSKEKESDKILDGNSFRDQLNLKSLKQDFSLPYDYTVKKKISFFSNSPFEWYGEQTSQEESKCLKAFVKDNKLNDIYNRIQQLLYFYVYPLNQLSTSSINILQKVLWKAKNKDLNDLMKNPTISEEEKDEIEYYKKLMMNGIRFTEIPYTPRSNVNIKQDSVTNGFQDRNGNILLFNDTISVHGLFNFLLNWKLNQYSNNIFIPILLSNQPFLNASIKLNQISKNSVIKRSIYNANQRKNITDEIYQFSIEGFILPSVTYELIDLVTHQYNKHIKIKKEEEEDMKAKNKKNDFTSSTKKDEGLYIEMMTDSRTVGINIFKSHIKKEDEKEDKNIKVKMEIDNEGIQEEEEEEEEKEKDEDEDERLSKEKKDGKKNSSTSLYQKVNSDLFIKQLLYYNSIYYFND